MGDLFLFCGVTGLIGVLEGFKGSRTLKKVIRSFFSHSRRFDG